MRAMTMLEALDASALRQMASRWKAQTDPLSVAAAMRGADAWTIVKRACATPVMLEDVALLCANPFDTVQVDELVEPRVFEAVGLIALTGQGEYGVNVDLALTLSAHVPLEFGFAATLLARLSGEDRATAARAMQVGPRPSIVDAVLDIASELSDPSRIMVQVAHLRDSEREVLREALRHGELPDDLEALALDAGPPTVRLDPGAAGQRGLVFRVSYPAAGLVDRAVVPLEVARKLPAVLAQVPPPPEPVAAKARKRPTSTGPRRERRTTTRGDSMSESSGARPMTQPDAVVRRSSDPRERSGSASAVRDLLTTSGAMSWSGSLSVVRDPVAASGTSSPFRLGRVTSIRQAGAIVDVETAKVAEAVLDDMELAADVLEVAAESLVVLRAGVDARAWAERCAVRLGL